MIYIIYGASGSGKTTLLTVVNDHLGEKAINKKATTRNKRSYDDIEVISYPDGIPRDKFEYFYSQYGYEYAIDKDQLTDAVKGEYHHFVICNDIETIKKIKRDFKPNVRIIYLNFDAPEASIREIQKRRGIKDDEIELRISKIQSLREAFIDHYDLFDEVIINKYGENPETNLWRQMERIISDDHPVPSFQIIQQTIDYLVELCDKRETIPTKQPIEKDYVFIIMSMNDQDADGKKDKSIEEDLYHIESTIKATAVDCRMRAGLADSSTNNQMIITKIKENIKKAEIVVADLTYERPNCYFELGYAMALNKDIIITAKKGTHIHFDISGYEIITYENVRILNRELKNCILRRRANNH